MEYRRLGKSGVKVSVIGLGTSRFGTDVSQEDTMKIVDAALDLGINFIDTANVYLPPKLGVSEEALGKALRGRWNKVILSTKFRFPMAEGPNNQGASRYHMMNAVEESLIRLKSDHIDLYYLHSWDESTPIEETLRAFDDLVRMGKVRYIGASSFASWQLAHANLLAEFKSLTPFVVITSGYNMLERDAEGEILPYCRAHNVGFVPFIPLAGGFLTGKYERGKSPPTGSRGEKALRASEPLPSETHIRQLMTDVYFDKIENLTSWAEARGRKVNELAHAWLLSQPKICSVISGATKIEQVLDNAKAADWVLTGEELEEVNSILE